MGLAVCEAAAEKFAVCFGFFLLSIISWPCLTRKYTELATNGRVVCKNIQVDSCFSFQVGKTHVCMGKFDAENRPFKLP